MTTESSMTFQETFAAIAQSDLPLRGTLDAFKREFDPRLAALAAVEALDRFVHELTASGAPGRGLNGVYNDGSADRDFGVG